MTQITCVLDSGAIVIGRLTRKPYILFSAVVFCVTAAAVLLLMRYLLSPVPDVLRPPEESNRVTHPSGFSIVRPNRTEARIEQDGEESIAISPGGRGRYNPHVFVRKCPSPPDMATLGEDGFADGSFQDCPR